VLERTDKTPPGEMTRKLKPIYCVVGGVKEGRSEGRKRSAVPE
jgi:hypothetical protein